VWRDDGLQNGPLRAFLGMPQFSGMPQRQADPDLHRHALPQVRRAPDGKDQQNRKFYGCEKYPECDFVSWEKPIPEKCPKCGSYMVEKRGKRGEHIHLCANETCRYKETVTKEEKDEE